MSDADAGQLIAGIAIVLLLLVLRSVGRKDVVVQEDDTITPPAARDGSTGAGPTKVVRRGTVLATADVEKVTVAKKSVRRSWLGSILVGKDNRTSTSKTVAFAWTMALAWGLLSLLVALLLGDDTPWDKQVELGWQDEYLLLLGGPYAAAILAKVAAVNRTDIKSEAGVGDAKAAQLVNDDEGSTDLGDFQYVVFNVIALLFFILAFAGAAEEGFPVLPDLLTTLVLTSVAGYTAKKVIAQARPTLISVIPATAAVGADVEVFGSALIVPGSVSSSGEDLHPVVTFGAVTAPVSTVDVVLGNDRVTVKVPAGVTGSAPIAVARADGVVAQTTQGTAVLAFTVAPGTPGE